MMIVVEHDGDGGWCMMIITIDDYDGCIFAAADTTADPANII